MANQKSTSNALIVAVSCIYTLAAIALALIAGRVLWKPLFERFDPIALYLFITAAVAVLLPFVLLQLPALRKVKVGEFEFEFGRLERDLPPIAPEELDLAGLPAEIAVSEEGEAWLVEGGATAAPDPSFDPDLGREREMRKIQSREIFMVHILRPSNKPGQKYDVFLFLARPEQPDLADVEHAEFYLGRYWRHRVFRVENRSRYLGIQTAAYGPFLAICRITFRNGRQVVIDRFVDFEMGRVFR